MKNVSRLSLIFVFALVLVLGPAFVASAQDGGTNPLCGGLAAAECQQLNTALTTMQGVNSFSIPNWTLTFKLDTGQEGQTPVSMTASGSAEFMMPADREANPEQVFAHMMITDFAVTGTDDDQSGSAEVIIQNGMSYVNWQGEWYGGEMSESDEAELAGAIADLSTGNLDFNSLGMDLTGVMTTTATEAAGMPGSTQFTATLAIDKLLAAFLGSPTGMGLLSGMMGGGTDTSGTEMQMSPEDIQAFSMMFSPIFNGTTITFGLVTGEDNYIHRSSLDVVLNLDLAALGAGTAPITGNLNFQADLDSYNETFTAEAPTEYKPLEELNTGVSVPDAGSLLGG